MSLHPDHPRKSYPSPVAPESNHEAITQNPAAVSPAVSQWTSAGHRFTVAQIDLQRQIGQCDGFPAIQAVLRRQFAESLNR